MKFTSEGNAKKDGLEYHIHFNRWLDQKEQKAPFFISIYNRNNNTGLSTERTQRFEYRESAMTFCNEISKGNISYDALLIKYQQAEEAHKAEKTAEEDKKIGEYLKSLVDMDVDPRHLKDILHGFSELQQELGYDQMDRVFDGDIFWQYVSEYIGQQKEKTEALHQAFQNNPVKEDLSEMISHTEVLTCVDLSKYEDMGLSELKKEQKELLGAISNENLWLKGSSDQDSIDMHKCNIAYLQEELEYVEEQIGTFSLDSHIAEAKGRTLSPAGDRKMSLDEQMSNAAAYSMQNNTERGAER